MSKWFWVTRMWLLQRCRIIARFVGRRLRIWGGELITWGEDEQCHWGGTLFFRLFMAEIEITGAYPKVYRGRIYGARFRMSSQSAKRVVVLRLNWLASRDERFGPLSTTPWKFGGSCDVVIDADQSPLRESDGTLWFMWPNGHYGTIRFDPAEYLPFSGAPETPRVYRYF